MDDPNYGLPEGTKDYLDEEFPKITERCSPLKLESRGLDPDCQGVEVDVSNIPER